MAAVRLDLQVGKQKSCFFRLPVIAFCIFLFRLFLDSKQDCQTYQRPLLLQYQSHQPSALVTWQSVEPVVLAVASVFDHKALPVGNYSAIVPACPDTAVFARMGCLPLAVADNTDNLP